MSYPAELLRAKLSLPLALAKTTFRVMNAVPALKRQAFKGFGED